jgi:hypothetical protein
MLTARGEFVPSKDAVAHLGQSTVAALNASHKMYSIGWARFAGATGWGRPGGWNWCGC